MRGVDTNVVVRLVTQDDPKQARRVDGLLAECAERDEKLHVTAVVLCEIAWVLRSAYRHARDEIARVLDALLETPEFVVQDADLARRALADYRAGHADFADHLIGHANAAARCSTTLTLDSALEDDALFTLL